MTGPDRRTVPSSRRSASNCGAAVAAAAASGVVLGGGSGLRSKASGSAVASVAAAALERSTGVPSGGKSSALRSVRVKRPPPSVFSASRPAVTAAAHSGEGVPRPTRQSAASASPAPCSAARIASAASGVSAVQAASVPEPVPSVTSKAKGEITGRGAEMSRARVIPCGAARRSRASRFARSASLSATAITATVPGATLTLARGNSASTERPKPSASGQPSGAGSDDDSSMSVTCWLSPPAPSAERIMSRPPVSGTRPISEMSASLRRSSSAKGAGCSGAVAAATVVVSSMVPMTCRTASSARKRLDSSGAAPLSVTLSPSTSVAAQSWPAEARAA